MKIISIVSIKGGVGKSALAILTALFYSKRGMKVLVIDLDHQASATLTLNVSSDKGIYQDRGTAKWLMGGKVDQHVVSSCFDHIDLMAADNSLTELRAIDVRTLKTRINQIPHEYDVVIIDTPGTFDNHVQSAIIAANIIITPVTLTSYCYSDAIFLSGKIELEDKIGSWILLPSLIKNAELGSTGQSLASQWHAAFTTTFGDHFIHKNLIYSNSIKKLLDVKSPLPKKMLLTIEDTLKSLLGENDGQ